MRKLLLFTTQGCHLCEQAHALTLPVLAETDYALELVEISESDDLMERYGLRIPVVLREGASRDLGWPFTAVMLREYLAF